MPCIRHFAHAILAADPANSEVIMAENSSQRHTELIAKVFLELGAQLPPHERERLSFSVEKNTDDWFIATCECGDHRLRLVVEDNQLTWAEGKKAGVGEFTVEQAISLIVRFVRGATAS